MRWLLSLFCVTAFAQETNIAPPATIGPVEIKNDTTSISAIDWANASQPVVPAFQQTIPKVGGGSEIFYQRPYTHGLSLEYAGLAEWMIEGFSLRYNFRYAHLKPKTYGNGPIFSVGDRLDTSGLFIQKVGTLRVDGSNNYVIEPETGQPYTDNQAVEISVRTFRGIAEEGLDAGDLRFITRGPTRKHEFRGGPKTNEQIYATIGPDGLIVLGVNYTTLIASLKSRIDALEQGGGPVNPPPLE